MVLVLDLRVHGHFAPIHAFEVVLLVGHLIVKTFAFGGGQVVGHGVGPASGRASGSAATCAVRQAVSELLEPRGRVKEFSKL